MGAAIANDLPILKWIVSHKDACHSFNFAAVIENIVAGGHLEPLVWMHDSGLINDGDLFRVATKALETGHMFIYRWALAVAKYWDNGFGFDCFKTAVKCGNLEIAKEMFVKYGNVMANCFWDYFNYGVVSGHLEVLKWCLSVGYTLKGNEWTFLNGNMEIFEFLVVINCPWNLDSCESLVPQGRIEIIQKARENGVPWGACMGIAAKNNNFVMLKWLHQSGCPWDYSDICGIAAFYNNLEMLKWALEHGRNWDYFSMCRAAANPQISMETLKWMLNNGCPFHSELICATFAKANNLKALKWAVSAGFQWGPETLLWAALAGNFKILKWSFKHGCPWEKNLFSFSMLSGHLEIFEWVINNVCEWSEAVQYIELRQLNYPLVKCIERRYGIYIPENYHFANKNL